MLWLGLLVIMVMCMVIVGGLTRLTDSGLSMVNWHPIHGTLPPLNTAEWKQEFSHYQQSPEYQQKNFGMSLDEFKDIFWLEYIHRVLGRTVGLLFALPFAFFLIRRMIPATLALKYGSIFLLGGAQGLLGWYMVKSGLVNDPMVSPLRLAAHLSMACLLFSLLFWQWLKLWQPLSNILSFDRAIFGFILLVFLQIILGAFVAGLDAGLAYDSFPTMNGQWIPEGLWLAEPWWKDLYQNPTTAQFIHRLGALILTVYLGFLLYRLKSQPLSSLAQKAAYGLIMVLIWQIALGALTVIHHVPILLAVLHQFTAVLLLACAIALLYAQSTARKQSA